MFGDVAGVVGTALEETSPPAFAEDLSDEYLWSLTCEAAEEWDQEPGGREPGDGTASLPPDLEELAPGPVLAMVVSAISPDELSSHDRVRLMRSHHRLASHFQARAYADMAGIHDALGEAEGDAELRFRLASAEVGAALRLTPRAGDTELTLALDLSGPYAPVFESFENGRLDRRRAGAIIRATSHLEPDMVAQALDRVLADAPDLTTGQLTARLQRVCLELDVDDATERLKQGVEERRVWAHQNPDGTAELAGSQLPPARVAAIRRRIDRMARALQGSHESRTLDQLRADVFLDLLSASVESLEVAAAPDRGVVDISVSAETVAGCSDAPGEIPGWGPVSADVARQVVVDQQESQWRVTVVDPRTRRPLAAVTTRRRPTSHQQRQVEARSPRCVAPGCRMPARDCDIDHIDPWAQTQVTEISSLAPLCGRHHPLKDHGWSYRLNGDGSVTWTTACGHVYTVRPEYPP